MTVDVRVGLAFGANPAADPGTWSFTDVTNTDARARVVIQRGRQNEGQERVEPSACSFQLGNPGGVYTPYNPTSIRYPNIRRDTPVQVKVGSNVRATQLVYDWKPGFQDGGGGPFEGAPVCDVDASGIVRRLAQGGDLHSPLYRAITAALPDAYWPLEDSAGSTSATSAAPLDPLPMSVQGTVRFAAESTLAGSDAAPNFDGGGMLRGIVRYYVPAGTGENTVDFWFRSTSTASTTHYPIEWLDTGTIKRWRIEITSTALNVQAFNSSGTDTLAGALTRSGDFTDDTWHNVKVVMQNVGADLLATLVVDGTSAQQTITNQSTFQVTHVRVNPAGLAGGALANVAHVAVWGIGDSTDFTTAGAGHAGEAAGTRIQRLCTEEGVAYNSSGVEANTSPMGAQPVAPLMEILRECEQADGGILYETRAGKLFYLTRTARYNPTVGLSLFKSHLSTNFQPTDDDQVTHNAVTVQRSGGSSASASDATHIASHGRYAQQVTLNLASDGVLLDHASWRVHKGTVEELRYPKLTLNLIADPSLVTTWLACDIGTRLTVANPPASLPPDPIDLVIEGYTEILDAVEWTVELVCAPAKPWTVAVYGSDNPNGTGTDRYEGSGSTLNGAHSNSTTSLSVATPAGSPLWTTDADDFPFDLRIGGEKMTVSVITGASSPQTFTVTRSVNGVVKAHSGGTAVELDRQGIYAL